MHKKKNKKKKKKKKQKKKNKKQTLDSFDFEYILGKKISTGQGCYQFQGRD